MCITHCGKDQVFYRQLEQSKSTYKKDHQNWRNVRTGPKTTQDRNALGRQMK
uniref:Uncharacterized protein n=1 Tax=Arion vulgaris TaxID=1028688 RepID=A0A0B7A5J1_9EUPU